MTPLFVGSFICQIDRKGSLVLPHELCVAVTSRASNADMYVSLHGRMNCLIVYDEMFIHEQLNGQKWQRIAGGGASSPEQEERVRRSFGFTARATLDGKGHIAIAPWLNERRGDAYRALVIGMGHWFEIWDLDHVITHEGADLRLLATLHLDLASAQNAKRDFHEPVLSPVRPHHHFGPDQQRSGLRVQPMPAVRPRHDPIVGRAEF